MNWTNRENRLPGGLSNFRAGMQLIGNVRGLQVFEVRSCLLSSISRTNQNLRREQLIGDYFEMDGIWIEMVSARHGEFHRAAVGDAGVPRKLVLMIERPHLIRRP